ncbi:hypothetical protein ABIE53_004976 [Burkholderia sp. OAS925]
MVACGFGCARLASRFDRNDEVPLPVNLRGRKRRSLSHRRHRDGVPFHISATLREGCARDLPIVCEPDLDYGRRMRWRVGTAGPEMRAYARLDLYCKFTVLPANPCEQRIRCSALGIALKRLASTRPVGAAHQCQTCQHADCKTGFHVRSFHSHTRRIRCAHPQQRICSDTLQMRRTITLRVSAGWRPASSAGAAVQRQPVGNWRRAARRTSPCWQSGC